MLHKISVVAVNLSMPEVIVKYYSIISLVGMVFFFVNAVVWNVRAFKLSEEPPAQELKYTEKGTPVIVRYDQKRRFAKTLGILSIIGMITVVIFNIACSLLLQ